MHKQRYYIDTSVFGGYFDIEFEKWSKIFINDILQGIHIPVLSDVTIREIEKAPKRVNEIFESILKCDVELIEVNEEIEILSNIYIHQKAISEKFKEDSLHIACATIYKVDALISWNFKHIVNVDRIRKYNSVNLFNNYNLLDIRTPMEVLNGNEEI
jgi:predicted nucleic acid-binding protein